MDINQLLSKHTSLFSLGSSADIEKQSTGFDEFDHFLGGGFPKGRVIQITSFEPLGKTTLALHHAARLQHDGEAVLFVDADFAFNIQYAKYAGIKLNQLLISQPETMEEAYQVMIDVAPYVKLIIIDSVRSLIPSEETLRSMHDQTNQLHVQTLKEWHRKLELITRKSGTLLIYTNQKKRQFRNKTDAFLDRECAIKIEISKDKTMYKGHRPYADRLTLEIVKNQFHSPFQSCQLKLEYDKGFANRNY